MDISTFIIFIAIIIIFYLIYKKITYVEKKLYQPLKLKLKSTLKSLKNPNLKTKKKVNFKLPKKEKNKKNKKNNFVFMDIGSNSKYFGKIIIKLFDNITPKTCENFRELCHKKKYYDAPFHRIIKDFMIQGGDFTKGDGTGGMSIFGVKFEDENFKLFHDKPYLLSMANSGPNTNGSQFFILTNPQPHLNGKHVVFGEITSGFEVIDELNDVQVSGNDRPLENIKILDCGIYDKKKVYKYK
jgi:cyclophilin family peptidyl-prolyl cis-trans isomerase